MFGDLEPEFLREILERHRREGHRVFCRPERENEAYLPMLNVLVAEGLLEWLEEGGCPTPAVRSGTGDFLLAGSLAGLYRNRLASK